MTAKSPLGDDKPANYSHQGSHTGARVRKLDGGGHSGQGMPGMGDVHTGQGIRPGVRGRKGYPNLPN